MYFGERSLLEELAWKVSQNSNGQQSDQWKTKQNEQQPLT